MKSTLEKVQTVYKVLKVLATILFVASIVSVVFCTIGLVIVSLLDFSKLDSPSYINLNFFFDDLGATKEIAMANILGALLSSIGNIIIAKFAMTYVSNELNVGTPFTFEGAKEVQRLGIITLGISIFCAIISGFVIEEVLKLGENVTVTVDNEPGVIIGVILCLFGLIFKLGAEQSNSKE